MRPASAPAGDQPRAPHALPGAVAGMLAAAVAIGAAQFVAGLTAPASSPVLAVGQAAIDLTPQPVKDFAISAFGTADKTVLVGSGIAAAAAVAGTIAGRELGTRRDVTVARNALRFPRPTVAAPPLPPGSDLHIPGLSSFITPNDSFYRVDTALLLPQVDPSTWQLRIHGMVQREVTITFAQLLRRPLIEDYVTLTCVSDPVGGPYVGNARWLGASLADLIRQAGPLAGADQLLCTSVDGFTSGTPLQVVLDGRDALLAVAMNGTALP